MEYNYEQVGEGQEKLRACMNDLVHDDGTCQMFVQLEKAGLAPVEEEEKCPHNQGISTATMLPSMVEWAKKKGLVQ